MRVQLFRANRIAELDEGGDDLAPALVGQADDRHFRHRGMQREAALDLNRGNILTAGYDHVVYPASDKNVAVLIRIAGITREVPAIPERLRICVRPIPVALERLVAGRDRGDLALLAGRRDVIHIRGAEPHDPDHLVDAGAPSGTGLLRGSLI